ncbi:restriction endonuclease subunit S [Rubeoparvulum massiliense]|uniref:restriction endonuclease subunit S n=1 Tax=Rubeoparvulum massiliense TaxID=1631346 RepID=UPI00069CCE4A|nr:restriction endonuclease subunit S [Rubeoparvulum massiliense]
MELKRLGDYVKIKTGKLDANASSENGEYPFFTCSVNNLWIDNFAYDCECVLIAGNGDLNVKYYEGKFNAYQRTYIVESNDKTVLDVRFLYYFMNKYIDILRNNSIGGVIKYIKLGALTDAQIPLPPLEIQKKIVEVLDKAQGLIDARKEQIRLMDELIQSVFYEMFGDPVTNSKGWETGTINDLTSKTQYGTSKKAHETDGEYPVLRMNNITYTGGWDFSSLKYVDLNEKELEKYLVNEGEMLFNRTNSKELVGKAAVYRENKPMAYAGYLVKLITNTRGNTEYISAYLNSKHGKATLLNMAKSIVGMANINAEELKKIRINLPPIDLQNDFAAIVSKIEKERKKLSESIRDYEDSYSSIMQKAFVGKLF